MGEGGSRPKVTFDYKGDRGSNPKAFILSNYVMGGGGHN